MKKRLGSAPGSKRRTRKGDVPMIDLSCCKYEVLRIVLHKNGWEEGGDDDKHCHLVWTDLSVGPERLMLLKQGQKINHFHGMLSICRKKSLFRSLTTMHKLFPSHYKFFPRAFVLPNQLPDLLACFSTSKVRTYILKPDNGSQGRGVVLAQSAVDVRRAVDGYPGSNLLAQKYLTNPMLINGYKFDLRIYVLILSCDPLRLYLYREGIVRFCTERYQKPGPSNLTTSCMHLTNYALNKYNSNFHFNTSATETNKGHKWALSSLFKALSIRGFDTVKLHRQISQIVVMTVLTIVPLLVHNYHTYLNEDDHGRSCFELLGMDVLIDHKCAPWLLEVNHSPSFSIDTPLDLKVKEALITDTLKLVRMDPSGVSRLRLQEKKGTKMRLYGKGQPGIEKVKSDSCGKPQGPQMVFHLNKDNFEEHELLNKGKYDRIYPSDDKKLQELYNIFLSGSEAAFKHSFDMKVKDTIAKVREERQQEQLAKEDEEKRKLRARIESRKKAQRCARTAALAALSARAKIYGAEANFGKREPSFDRLKDTKSGGVSPKGLEEDMNREKSRSVGMEDTEVFGMLTIRTGIGTLEDLGQMGALEKVANWKAGDMGGLQRECTGGLKRLDKRDDMVASLEKLLGKEDDKVLAWVGKSDGGVSQMLGDGEERILERVGAQKYGETRVPPKMREVVHVAKQKRASHGTIMRQKRSRSMPTARVSIRGKGSALQGTSALQILQNYRSGQGECKSWRSRGSTPSKENRLPVELPQVKESVAKFPPLPRASPGCLFWETATPLVCKSIQPPSPEPPCANPVPQLKISLGQAFAKGKLADPRQETLMITRRYHGKLPELVRNETFFTIQGYSLPASMARFARFAPKTPKNHQRLSVVKRPLIRAENFANPPSRSPASYHSRPKSRLNSSYIIRAQYRIARIQQAYHSWPWKTASPVPKGLFSKAKQKAGSGRMVGGSLVAEPSSLDSTVSGSHGDGVLHASSKYNIRESGQLLRGHGKLLPRYRTS